MIEIIKLLTDNTTDSSQDKKLQYYMDAATKKVLKYCNLDKLPEALEDVVVQMVVDRVEKEELIFSEIGPLKFEKVNKPIDELEPYKSILNKFKKVRVI